ncbi:hypothetical protein ACJJTC_016539 [Scirpophaga incertulas]
MPVDIAGFVGFTAAEGAAAEDVNGRRQQQWLRLVRQQRQSSRLFSDDDGFFDWSSADTDGAAATATATATPTAAGDSADAARKASLDLIVRLREYRYEQTRNPNDCDVKYFKLLK